MIDENLLTIMKGRRSIRVFDLDKSVETEKIEQVVESANWAPSACNAQAWHFIIIDDKGILDDLVKSGLKKAKNTPVVIFVFYRRYVHKKPINTYLDDHIQSASAAIQNMLLMAYNIGLGATWINGIDLDMKKILEIPYGYEFIAMVRMGYPRSDNIKSQKRNYRVSEIVSYNEFLLPKKDLERVDKIVIDKMIEYLKRYRVVQFAMKIVPISIKNKIMNKDIETFKKN